MKVSRAIKKVVNDMSFLDGNRVSHGIKTWVRDMLMRPLTVTSPYYYPTDLNLEVTSICNSRCTYCCHDRLIRSGIKTARHMPLEEARYSIGQLKQMTRGIPESLLSFIPIGLGEPLLSPYFFEIVAYARRVFPSIQINANTNAIALDEANAEKLVDCGIDSLILSVNFDDPELYRRMNGVDKCSQVKANVERFLKIKGNRSPSTYVQMLDLKQNYPRFRSFVSTWKPLLNSNDHITLREFVDFQAPLCKGRKFLCSEPWTVIFIDIEGDVYPCCLGLWRGEGFKKLRLGHITDPPKALMSRLEIIHQTVFHMNPKTNGDFTEPASSGKQNKPTDHQNSHEL